MASNLIFLSHIHDEKALAAILKTAIEEEFSGFVEVFQSSDPASNPVGTNFLKRIENSLTDCVGAIYLISPASVKRSWISFELGAIWIRNVISVKSGGAEIPTLPLCHSGAKPSELPAPLNNLSGVIANQASELESAFRALQAAVGAKGRLRTDFVALADQITAFERQYTVSANIAKLFSLLGLNQQARQDLVARCEVLTPEGRITVTFDFLESSVIQQLKALEKVELKGHLLVQVKNPHTMFGSTGAINGGEVSFSLPGALVLEARKLLLG